ncbi:hypothetical protein ES705_05476 [subsurface metagenome]
MENIKRRTYFRFRQIKADAHGIFVKLNPSTS